jgi:hypothetical protein
MVLRSESRGFVRVFRRGDGVTQRPGTRIDAIARTAGDALSPRNKESSSSAYDSVAEGAPSSQKSFERE